MRRNTKGEGEREREKRVLAGGQRWRCYFILNTRSRERKAVRRGWLRKIAIKSFIAAYPDKDVSSFVFSNGWFARFLARHHISLRLTTNKLQKLPSDYISICVKWTQFNHRNSQVRPGVDSLRVVGQYSLSAIQCSQASSPSVFSLGWDGRQV